MGILPLGSWPVELGLGKSCSPHLDGGEPAWLPRMGQPLLLAFLKSAAVAARWAFQEEGKWVQ